MTDQNKSMFEGVPLIGGNGQLPGTPSKEEIAAAANREAEMQRVGGLVVMRNEFAAAALSALIAKDGATLPRPTETVVRLAFEWGQCMAVEAAKRIDKDMEKFGGG